MSSLYPPTTMVKDYDEGWGVGTEDEVSVLDLPRRPLFDKEEKGVEDEV